MLITPWPVGLLLHIITLNCRNYKIYNLGESEYGGSNRFVAHFGQIVNAKVNFNWLVRIVIVNRSTPVMIAHSKDTSYEWTNTRMGSLRFLTTAIIVSFH